MRLYGSETSRDRNPNSRHYFTGEAQSSQRSEYFLIKSSSGSAEKPRAGEKLSVLCVVRGQTI
jgi:hypothetical protein